MTNCTSVNEWNLNGGVSNTVFVDHWVVNEGNFSEWNMESSLSSPPQFFVVGKYNLDFSSGENSMYLGVV